MIYLDNSATTKPLKVAVEAVDYCLNEAFFNPSSAYGPAVAAERKVEEARGRLGRALGASPQEIIYTSGGTESNNAAILGTLRASRGKGRIIATQVEHPSVYEVFHMLADAGYEVAYLGVDDQGRVKMEELAPLLNDKVQLVSMMHVNNETGAINDIGQAYSMIRRWAPQALLHVDGVQAFCKLPFGKVPCDLYSISGHKFHAPKGVGALYVRNGVRWAGGQIGGGQEMGRRSGTTNTPGILGMDAALGEYSLRQQDWAAYMRSCKVQLAQRLLTIPDTIINGPGPQQEAPHILNVSFLGVRGEVLLHALEQKEIYVSTGSACSAHKKGKNRVLNAMGVIGPRQEGAIRFSLCPFNTVQEMDQAADAIAENVAFLRRFQRR